MLDLRIPLSSLACALAEIMDSNSSRRSLLFALTALSTSSINIKVVIYTIICKNTPTATHASAGQLFLVLIVRLVSVGRLYRRWWGLATGSSSRSTASASPTGGNRRCNPTQVKARPINAREEGASGSGRLLLVVGEVAVAVAPDAGARGARAELERPHGDRESSAACLEAPGTRARPRSTSRSLTVGRESPPALASATPPTTRTRSAAAARPGTSASSRPLPQTSSWSARARPAGLVVDGGGADVREAALDGGGRQRRARGVERRDAGGRHAGLEVAEVEVAGAYVAPPGPTSTTRRGTTRGPSRRRTARRRPRCAGARPRPPSRAARTPSWRRGPSSLAGGSAWT